MGKSATDGRLLRSERSREAIVNALYELVREGVVVPTAQQVAERADVGVRTVFRQFSDMDTLFASMDERLRSEVDHLVVGEVQSGSIDSRVDALIDRRTALYGIIAPYRRTSIVQRWRSPFIQEQFEDNNRIFQKDLRDWLPEFDDLDPQAASAVEAALSFEFWDRLRIDQKLGAKRTAGAIARTVRALLSEPA